MTNLVHILAVRARAAILLVGVLLGLRAGAQAPIYTQDEVTAGMLVSLIDYVDWPTDHAIFFIGILGEDPLGVILENMAQQKDAAKIRIVHYQSASEVDDQCSMLFVTRHYKGSLPDLFKALSAHKTLTVGDGIAQFCELGGMIRINPKDDPKSFDVNRKAAEYQCLRIHTELMRLARNVSDTISRGAPPCNH